MKGGWSGLENLKIGLSAARGGGKRRTFGGQLKCIWFHQEVRGQEPGVKSPLKREKVGFLTGDSNGFGEGVWESWEGLW